MILEKEQIELTIETLSEYICILNKEDLEHNTNKYEQLIEKVKELKRNLHNKSNKEIISILKRYNKKIEEYYLKRNLEM